MLAAGGVVSGHDYRSQSARVSLVTVPVFFEQFCADYSCCAARETSCGTNVVVKHKDETEVRHNEGLGEAFNVVRAVHRPTGGKVSADQVS